MMTRLSRVASVATAVALPLLLVAPAGAESITRSDPADATASPTDIRKVTVNHTDHNLKLRIKFADLATGMSNATSSASIYVDTRRGHAGPEFVMGIPLFRGSDWAVVRTHGWRPGDRPINCRSQLRLKPRHDVAIANISRKCLARPAKARVSIKMVDWYDGSHVVRDWFPKRKSFTRWLAAG
jgi:hypothetical protein